MSLQYQRKIPETIEVILDKDGNAHLVENNVLTGNIIQRADIEKDWFPVPLSKGA